MIVELTEAERFIEQTRYSLGESKTLAWRAFGKALGVQLHDSIVPMDGDGTQREPITERWFHFEEAKGQRYLSLGRFGCWDEGAMRSLSPGCTYISYSVDPDGAFVDFHGWHRPKEESRIIPKDPDGRAPFLTKDQLSSMGILVGVMRRQIAHTGPIS